MELKTIDASRVILLTHTARPSGQLFLPAAGMQLVARYKFQKAPNQTEILGDTLTFQHGVFEDVGVNELSIYQDGIVAASRASTELLDRFVDDVLSWAASDLGLVETGIPPREKHYESGLVISMDIRDDAIVPQMTGVAASLTKYQERYGLRPFEFSFGGLSWATDTMAYTGRKPMPFTLGRRINVPFEAGIYYSNAPLKTNDHIALLRQVEKLFS